MELMELISWVLRGDGILRFVNGMTLSEFVSTTTFLLVYWYFLNNQIKKGFQNQDQQIKDIIPLVEKQLSDNGKFIDEKLKERNDILMKQIDIIDKQQKENQRTIDDVKENQKEERQKIQRVEHEVLKLQQDMISVKGKLKINNQI